MILSDEILLYIIVACAHFKCVGISFVSSISIIVFIYLTLYVYFVFEYHKSYYVCASLDTLGKELYIYVYIVELQCICCSSNNCIHLC